MGFNNSGTEPEDIHEQILHADHSQISQILNALIQRFSTLYPNDELLILSLPKTDLMERRKILDAVFTLLKEHNQI